MRSSSILINWTEIGDLKVENLHKMIRHLQLRQLNSKMNRIKQWQRRGNIGGINLFIYIYNILRTTFLDICVCCIHVRTYVCIKGDSIITHFN